MSLTPAQKRAVAALREQEAISDPTWEGWGVMLTTYGSRVEDGQARIYFKTALVLERKGVVELDYRFGRVRLIGEER